MHKITVPVHIAYESSEGSDEPVHPRRLVSVFAPGAPIEEMYMKTSGKIKTFSPIRWLCLYV